MADALEARDLRARVQNTLDSFRIQEQDVLAPLGEPATALLDAVFSLLQGGKRLRAAFCFWGYLGSGGADGDPVVRAASAMEVFQAAALLHDDVMDASDIRRGQPTAHVALAAQHRRAGWYGDPDRFGEAGAILAGDLCLNWTDQLFATCGMTAQEVARGRVYLDQMRTQLMGGQFLDIVESARSWRALSTQERVESARTVIRFKSAGYTIAQPLMIGAASAGAAESSIAALSDYGYALGEAFQLRDDLLGVFGDPATTGKPAGDDIREGKRTVLVAYLLDAASPSELERFDACLGSPDLTEDDVHWVRKLAISTGAVDRVEDLIDQQAAASAVALERAELTDEARSRLIELITVCTARTA
ncbi:geranylgeranyl diphosphate synthase type I [Branchiibius hedensis]|uniref:Geranylgeranyl diphosphate synthase, type I n=1 Tax=Branchiibius hedensis TaxID=672460 RepID=A0A2Y8ZQQ9_9MICO|nr:polyprenyl synthetase family protein [Branchiibius hedensis]PWJ24842.1 geranylgeranyl diphosphate synthase type I [Branchiibius hedensis]SSA33658.1 geranylgeranyl diphosphate synthase, type I [Branchiibius hedensis]